jgi:predicted GIY-YIG superfamily endonuclease
MVGYMYILECADGTLYVRSTNDLLRRIKEHFLGIGAAYTANRLPVKLMFFEEYDRIDLAFNREQQVKGWSHKKKLALILDIKAALKKYAECQNDTHYKNRVN